MDTEWGFVATEEEPKTEWVFEFSKIFDSAPTINHGPHNEDESLASNKTDTSMYTNTTTTNQKTAEKEQEKETPTDESNDNKQNNKDESETSDQTNNGDTGESAEQKTSALENNE